MKTNTKTRQDRYVRAAIKELLQKFLRKRVGNKGRYLENESITFSDDFIISVSWSLDELIDDATDHFVSSFEYYWNEGYAAQKDFSVGVLSIDDPDWLFPIVYEHTRVVPEIKIPYENMRSIMRAVKRYPSSNHAWNKLMKAVYTRSRTRGFIEPAVVESLSKTITKHYVHGISPPHLQIRTLPRL